MLAGNTPTLPYHAAERVPALTREAAKPDPRRHDASLRHTEAMPAGLSALRAREVADALHLATQGSISLMFFTCGGFIASALWHGWLATAMFGAVFALGWAAQRTVRRAHHLAAQDAVIRGLRS